MILLLGVPAGGLVPRQARAATSCSEDRLCDEQMRRATGLFEQGAYEAALGAYLQAEQRVPLDPQVLLLSGLTLLRLCRYDEALVYHDRFRAAYQSAYAALEPQVQQLRQAALEKKPCMTRPDLAPQMGSRKSDVAVPVYKRGWFWGVIGAVAAATALGLGLGLGLQTAEAAGGRGVAQPVPWQ